MTAPLNNSKCNSLVAIGWLSSNSSNHGRALSASGLVMLLAVGFVAILQSTPAYAIRCSTGQPIDISLPQGTRWEMCWHEDANSGIELTSIFVTLPGVQRRRVLRSASVAQIHEAFDNNAPTIHHVTQIGLGGSRLQTLNNTDCRPSERLSSQGRNSRAVLCQRVTPRGLAYKYQGAIAKGDLLELYSVSRTGRSNFVVRWQFLDNGEIVPSIGATGQLQYYTRNPSNGWKMNNSSIYAVGSTLNIFWRLDFALGASGANDTVDWIETWSSTTKLSKAVYTGRILLESFHTVSSNRKRSWRITDGTARNSDATDGRGHVISYHLDPITTGHRYIGPSTEPWSRYDIFMTRYRTCERFATDNARVERSCGDNVMQYVNGRNIDGTDIVLWYKVTRHRLPSNEDEPTRPIEWNQFTIYPRDWTPTNPLGVMWPTPIINAEAWS